VEFSQHWFTGYSLLQELCVTILPSFAGMVDYSSMKHSIVPRITALCIGSKGSSVREGGGGEKGRRYRFLPFVEGSSVRGRRKRSGALHLNALCIGSKVSSVRGLRGEEGDLV
jgi:hypothetical protein